MIATLPVAMMSSIPEPLMTWVVWPVTKFVIAFAIIMGIVARDAAKGLELHRVELIGIYWHFVDIVWIFLFPLLYIAK